jgi:spore maturation protein CgeB
MDLLHIGFTDAAMIKGFSKSFDNYRFVDWTSWVSIKNTAGLRSHIIDLMEKGRYDVVFMQIQSPDVIDGETAKRMSELCGLLINWTWDYREPTPEWFYDVAPFALSCFTNEVDVDNLLRFGCRAEFLQSGFDDEVYSPDGQLLKGTPEIVFMANNYLNEDEIFPLSDFRLRLVRKLKERYGDRFGVYGFGWPGQSPLVNFMHRNKAEADVYRSSKVAINLSHFEAERYTSDRMLRILGTGTLCLSHRYPGIEKDFVDGEHLLIWDDEDRLFALIDEYAGPGFFSSTNIAGSGCKLVHMNYKWCDMASRIKNFYNTYA